MANGYPEYQARVLQERYDLNVKIIALQKFLARPDVPTRDLLEKQAAAMLAYRTVLDERINLFDE